MLGSVRSTVEVNGNFRHWTSGVVSSGSLYSRRYDSELEDSSACSISNYCGIVHGTGRKRGPYSSVRRRAAGLVTLIPRTFALENVISREPEQTGDENGPLEDNRAVAAADAVSNLGSEGFVVHEQKVDFPHVVDQEFLEAVGE